MAGERSPSPGGRMKELAGHSAVYGLGGLAARLVGIFLLPVYAHRVSQAEYGEVELVMAAVALAAIALRLGLTNGMFRFSMMDRSPGARERAIRTAFASVLALSTLGLAVGLLLVGPLETLLSVDRDLVLLGLFGLWVSMNYDIVTAVYRIEQRPQAFVAFSLANVGLTVALTLVFVVSLDLGAVGIMLGNFSGTYIVYALLLVARRETLGFRGFDRDLLRRMLDYSLPLVPAGLTLWALNVADRFQVQRLDSPASLGAYSAAAKIALGIMLLVTAFQTAWAPFAFSIDDDREAKKAFRLAFSYWSIVTGWGLVAIALLAPPYIRGTMPEEWWDAEPVVPLLLVGSVLYGAYMIVRVGVNRSGRTRYTPIVTAIAAAVNIGLNFVLIPAWGIVGAGVSTVVGYGLLVLLGWLNAQRGFPVAYDWLRVARVAAVVAVWLALSVWAVPPAGALGVGLRLGLIAAFPLALLAVGAMHPGERARIRAFLAQPRGGRRGQLAADEEAAEEAEETELGGAPFSRPGA